jgi:hypothetical protein
MQAPLDQSTSNTARNYLVNSTLVICAEYHCVGSYRQLRSPPPHLQRLHGTGSHSRHAQICRGRAVYCAYWWSVGSRRTAALVGD